MNAFYKAALLLSTVILACAAESGTSAAQAPERPNCDGWQRPFEVDETLFPFQSHCVALAQGRIHYIDEPAVRPTELKGTILAVHSNPLWSLAWSKVAQKATLQGYRFIALDLFGFGMSDKPSPARYDYFNTAQAKTLVQFIEALDLNNLTLLVQDGGGPIGLSAATLVPERFRDFVIVNTWFKDSPPIEPRATDPQFIFFDWATDNVVNERYWRESGQNAMNGARGGAKHWGFEKGTPEYEKVRQLFLAPYWKDAQLSVPVVDYVHLPHVRLVQSIVLDRPFFQRLEDQMHRITDKPISLLFGDAVAFGTVKADSGPRTRANLDSEYAQRWGARQLSGKATQRALCPEGLRPSDEEIVPFVTRCDHPTGGPVWHLVGGFTSIWDPDKIAGVKRDLELVEYASISDPNAVLEGITWLNHDDQSN